ncbi:MAG: DUF2007 domain-containing protein [Alphaproteobacteria bacterium]
MSDRFVTVARYYDMIEPQIAKGVLEQHGLLCHLIGENHVRAESLAIIGLGGIQLRVHESDLEAARELLNLDDIALSTDVCPQCGKREVGRGYSSFLAVWLELFILPRSWLLSRRKCNSCGYRWNSEKTSKANPTG